MLTLCSNVYTTASYYYYYTNTIVFCYNTTNILLYSATILLVYYFSILLYTASILLYTRTACRHQHRQPDVGSESPSGPLKARKKLGARKKSEENLLDDTGSSGKILRPASSAEDLHVLNVHSSPKVKH